jgi:NHLM bacteriocin system ABC transporter peptidase/ATP-binding protein
VKSLITSTLSKLRRLWPLRRRDSSRAQVPSVLQMEAVECGAASLAMILAYFGRVIPLEALRLACGVSRDGSRAQNIIKAARSYGLIAKAFQKDVADLKTLRTPFIAHWNFNHFLVVEGIRGNQVYLNDPATGPRTITAPELDAAFTGVVLTFEPGANFQKGGQQPSVVEMLRRRLSGTAMPFVFLIVGGLNVMLLTLVMPSIQGIFVDDVLIKGLLEWVMPLSGALLAAAAGIATFSCVQQWHLFRLQSRIAFSGSSQTLWHLLTLPIGFFTQRNAGELGTRVALNDRVAQVLSSEMCAALLGAAGILIFSALMVGYDITLTLVVFATTILNVVSVRLASRQRVNMTRRLSQEQGKMMGTAMGGLQSIETLKAMGGESDFFARWSGYQTKVLGGQQSVKLQMETLALVPVVLGTLNAILILAVGGHRVMDGSLSIGGLLTFQTLATLIAMPVQQVVTFGTSVPEVEAQLGRVEDVLQSASDPQVRPPSPADIETGSDKLTGLVELKNVTFGYSPLEKPIIDDLNLTLQPGSRVALVGGSGSGKSTIARLVCGLYEPWEGSILFDGIPRQDLSHYQLSHSFAVVDQEVFLFEGSIRENLTLWDSTFPDADVALAASDACIHEEIVSRPGGYNGRVEEGGRNFSGGQAQRLEIARALAGNPTVLVLDEATSALDPTTERIFDDNLRRRGCTCLLIAHRLSTIRDCDEIVVLEQGHIVQRGTHEQMKAVPGPYAKLIASEESCPAPQ